MIREQIISLASSFVHMTYDKNNDIKFISDYYGRNMHKKIAYCCMFVWDIFRMAGQSPLFYNGNKTASCTELLNYYKKKKPTMVHTNINRCKPGDLVFYQFDKDANADHIGIFENINGTSHFYAIEGNTSNSLLGSQSNGGWVMRKNRSIKKVMAFVSFSLDEDKQCPYIEPATTVAKGTKGSDAMWVQWWLNQKGYPCDIDGSIGAKTDKLIKQFQKEYYPEVFHLEVDGKCGAKTRRALQS